MTTTELKGESNIMKHKALGLAALAAATSLAWTIPGEARVTRIIIDQPATSLAADPTYETITGRAFGELDPRDGTNALITDIDTAAGTGKATYVASFFIVKPKDMSTTSGLMWQDRKSTRLNSSHSQI